MHVQLSRWGNSLGLRLPRALATQIGLREGEKVDITADGDRLIIQALSPTWTIEDLLAGMSPGTMHEAFSWGDDEGREVVDE